MSLEVFSNLNDSMTAFDCGLPGSPKGQQSYSPPGPPLWPRKAASLLHSWRMPSLPATFALRLCHALWSGMHFQSCRSSRHGPQVTNGLSPLWPTLAVSCWWPSPFSCISLEGCPMWLRWISLALSLQPVPFKYLYP